MKWISNFSFGVRLGRYIALGMLAIIVFAFTVTHCLYTLDRATNDVISGPLDRYERLTGITMSVLDFSIGESQHIGAKDIKTKEVFAKEMAEHDATINSEILLMSRLRQKQMVSPKGLS